MEVTQSRNYWFKIMTLIKKGHRKRKCLNFNSHISKVRILKVGRFNDLAEATVGLEFTFSNSVKQQLSAPSFSSVGMGNSPGDTFTTLWPPSTHRYNAECNLPDNIY